MVRTEDLPCKVIGVGLMIGMGFRVALIFPMLWKSHFYFLQTTFFVDRPIYLPVREHFVIILENKRGNKNCAYYVNEGT